MKNFKPKNKALSITMLSLAALTVLSSGCGSAVRDTKSQASQNYSNSAQNPDNLIIPPPTDTINIIPSYATNFSLPGNGTSETNPISTDTILKVRIDPGSAGTITYPGSNFSANYGCIQYNVTMMMEVPRLNSQGQPVYNAQNQLLTDWVNGKTVTTSTLKVDGGNAPMFDQCEDAPTHQVIEFSDRLSPGHLRVKLKVDQPKYDFYCQRYWYCYNNYYFDYSCQYLNFSNYSMYCPLHTVYQTHTVTGNLDIQINGSGF